MRVQLVVSLVVVGAAIGVRTAGDERTANLAFERGVTYEYLDPDGSVLPSRAFGDDGSQLRDRKSRTGGCTARGVVRVRFDFTTRVSPQRVVIDRQWQAGKPGTVIKASRVSVGDSPGAMALVAEGGEVTGDYTMDTKQTEIALGESEGRFVQIEIEGQGALRIREIEVWGLKSDLARIRSAPPAAPVTDTSAMPGRTDIAGLPASILSVPGVTVLRHDMDESEVRHLFANAKANTAFVVPPGASWTMKGTLLIPDEVTVVGLTGGRSGTATFTKGFDGPLATVGSWVTLHGLYFDGNRGEFEGDGLVDPEGNGVREQRFVRVEVRNCAGSGFVFRVPHYYSIYQFCTFDRNDGYGVVYGEVRSHHTDNVWDSCHYGWNTKGGVAFHGVEASSIWENCEFFHNGGAAFDHFLINKKTGSGEPVGPVATAGAGALVIRNTVIRNHAGPVWLNRGGRSEAIVFADCRLKHNGHPNECSLTRELNTTPEAHFGITGPVGGLFHVEEGQLFVELRGGFAWDNGRYMFTTSPNSAPGSRLTIAGSARSGNVTGSIHAPNAMVTVLDATLLQEDAQINVQSGIGLDPRTGQVLKYGPADSAPPPEAEEGETPTD